MSIMTCRVSFCDYDIHEWHLLEKVLCTSQVNQPINQFRQFIHKHYLICASKYDTDARFSWIHACTVWPTTNPWRWDHWHQAFLTTTTYCSTNNTPSDHWHRVFLITIAYCSTNNTHMWSLTPFFFLITTTYCVTNNRLMWSLTPHFSAYK